MVTILSILIFGSIVASYFYLTRNYNYWRDRNIPYAKGTLPGFGHTLPLFLMRKTLLDLLNQICNAHPNHSMVGFYYHTTPSLVIREPELIKTVLQTNFASFSKNMWKVDPHLDYLDRLNPFFNYGDTWLIARRCFTLPFTTKNLKIFFNSIEQVCEKFELFLNDSLRKNNNVLEFELNDLANRYTAAVASSLSLSVENVCFESESRSLSLFNIVEKMVGKDSLDLFVQVLNIYFFDLKKFLRLSSISTDIMRYFSTIIKKEMQEREQEESAHKFDFLQLMLDLKKNKVIDDDVISTHILTFFFNVSDTSSVSLGFVGYQIACHPHVQQKLRDEVKSVLAKYDGRLTYDAVNEMTYMDQVMKESRRIYSSVPCFAKVCTEEFELKGSDGLSCRVQPGTNIFLNVYELQRNPKYWPNPEVFDVDRFASDRKTEIDKYTYLPFGEGPRICPGMRLALLQSKAYLAMIMKNYSLELSPKTPKEPFTFMPGRFTLMSEGGLWVNFKPL